MCQHSRGIGDRENTADSGEKGRQRIDRAASRLRRHKDRFDEVLRVIDSLQLTAKYKVATPANWQPGEHVIIAASVSDDEARRLFPDGWSAPEPYIRVVPQPRM